MEQGVIPFAGEKHRFAVRNCFSAYSRRAARKQHRGWKTGYKGSRGVFSSGKEDEKLHSLADFGKGQRGGHGHRVDTEGRGAATIHVDAQNHYR